MDMENQGSDEAILAGLGERLRDARLEQNLSQSQLAESAGVGRGTLQRMEAGESPSLINLIRVLRVLGLLGGFERLLPDPAPSPIDELDRRGKRRQRAGSPRAVPDGDQGRRHWRWGDEEPRGDT